MRTHGLYYSPTYMSWHGMIQRCRDANHASYKDYGGRGIKVCAQWKDMRNFVADMGLRPDGMTLDRIDVNGNYEPGNCRWATIRQQNNNRRNVRLISAFGRTQSVAEWARERGLDFYTLVRRIYNGWDHELALTTPVLSPSARPKGRPKP